MKKIFTLFIIALVFVGTFAPYISSAQDLISDLPPEDPRIVKLEQLKKEFYAKTTDKGVDQFGNKIYLDKINPEPSKPTTPLNNDPAVIKQWNDYYEAHNRNLVAAQILKVQTTTGNCNNQPDACIKVVEEGLKTIDDAAVARTHARNSNEYLARNDIGNARSETNYAGDATAGADAGFSGSDEASKAVDKAAAEAANSCLNSVGIPTNIPVCIKQILAWIAYIILYLMSWLVGLAGLLLDTSIQWSVLDMSKHVNETSAIGIGWTMLRDIGNMVFIFLLLYVAVKTILGLADGQTMRLIRNIIIIAILVNFSLFFTKVVIDASNVLSIGFYNKMISDSASTGGYTGVQSFSANFAKPLGITGIFDASSFAKNTAATQDFSYILVLGIGGSIMLFLVAFTFLYAAVLFIIRYVVLIFVMIFSAIAFIAWVMPEFRGQFVKWRTMLIGQALFAPLYMILIYLVMILANNMQFLGGATGNLADQLAGQSQLLAATQGATSAGSSTVDLIIKFFLIIGFLNVSTAMAKSFASQGSSRVSDLVRRGTGGLDRAINSARERAVRAGGAVTAAAAGAAGRNTVGRLGSFLSGGDSRAGAALRRGTTSKNIITRNLAKATLGGLQKSATTSYDIRNTAPGSILGEGGGEGGYEKKLRTQVDRVQERAKEFGGATPETLKRIADARSALKTSQQAYYAARKTKDVTAQEKALRDMRKASGDLARAEKSKSRDIRNQQVAYMTWLSTSRSKSTLLTKTARRYKVAAAEFLKKVGPESADDELKAKAADAAGAIKQALAATTPNVAEIRTIMRDMRDSEIARMDSEVFVKKDPATGVYTARPETIDNLRPSHLDSMKKELNNGEKSAIRDYINAQMATTAPSAEIRALNDYLQSNAGKTW